MPARLVIQLVFPFREAGQVQLERRNCIVQTNLYIEQKPQTLTKLFQPRASVGESFNIRSRSSFHYDIKRTLRKLKISIYLVGLNQQ